jgi:uncharacterized membrane protein YfcA
VHLISDWHGLLPYVVFAVTFVSSILSGMTGGGGGYVITPFLIAIGLTPQQSVATIKIWALGMDSGSITAYRSRRTKNKSLALAMIAISVPVALATVFILRRLPNENLQLAMGWLNLLMIPILFIKHHEVTSRRRHEILQAVGFILIISLMLLQGIFASGVGSLINVVLIAVFGVSVLETNLIKRKASLVTDIIVIAGLAGSGLINFKLGLIGAAGGLLGGYIGSKFSLHEGERFARYALMVFMVVSGVWLIVTANT